MHQQEMKKLNGQINAKEKRKIEVLIMCFKITINTANYCRDMNSMSTWFLINQV